MRELSARRLHALRVASMEVTRDPDYNPRYFSSSIFRDCVKSPESRR